MISRICGTQKTLIHRYREQIDGYQRQGSGVDKMGERDPKVQTSNFKTNKS